VGKFRPRGIAFKQKVKGDGKPTVGYGPAKPWGGGPVNRVLRNKSTARKKRPHWRLREKWLCKTESNKTKGAVLPVRDQGKKKNQEPPLIRRGEAKK